MAAISKSHNDIWVSEKLYKFWTVCCRSTGLLEVKNGLQSEAKIACDFY